MSPPDGNWGSQDTWENGTKIWNGMVRQLELKEVDLCGASLTITEERSQVIDFSIGVLQDIISISVPNPALAGGQAKDINILVFLTVFTKTAWLGILVTAIISSAVYALVALFQKDSFASALNYLHHFALGMQDFFLSLIQRNSNTGQHLKLTAARVLMVTTSSLTFILFTYYGGDLTATMTAGLPAPSLKSFQDILDSEYKFHLSKGTFIFDNLAHAEPDTVQFKLFTSKLEPMDYQLFLQEQIQKPSKAVYLASEFAFLKENALIFVKDFDDRLTSQLAFALQKDSDLTNILNYHLTKLLQSGMIKKFSQKWFKDDRPDDMSHRIFEEEAIPLGYENLFFPSLIMLVGISSGLGFAIIERMYKKPASNSSAQFYPSEKIAGLSEAFQ